MITTDEINLVKDSILGYTLLDLENLIGYRNNTGLILNKKIDDLVWEDISKDLIITYTENIKKIEFNKFRKKIELKNAKKGFIVAPMLLIASEKCSAIKIQHKKIIKARIPVFHKTEDVIENEKTEKQKIKSNKNLHIGFRIKIFNSFRAIDYDSDLNRIYQKHFLNLEAFNEIKDYLMSIFLKYDKKTYNQINSSCDFKMLFRALPQDKILMKKLCKFHRFDLISQMPRGSEGNSSIRTFPIPIGGKNK